MTHRGPFQTLPFCDSMTPSILLPKNNQHESNLTRMNKSGSHQSKKLESHKAVTGGPSLLSQYISLQ